MSAEFKHPPGQPKAWFAHFRGKLTRAMLELGLEGETEVKRLMSQAGTGRIYLSRRIKSESGRTAARKQLKKIRSKFRSTRARINAVHALKRNRGLHVASAPGQPPAVDTSELRSSVGWEVRGGGSDKEPAKLLLGIRSGASGGDSKLLTVAMTLEKGSFKTGRSKKGIILPRPAWIPAARMIEKRLLAKLAAQAGK